VLGYRPTWALGSAGAIANLSVLPGIEVLTILGEADESGTNARASQACVERWTAAGVDVEVLEPFGGKDANDVLQAVVR
jgi:putative DNA primase/helicase